MSDFPTLPPPPDDCGEYLAYLSGALRKVDVDGRTGAFQLVLTVDEEFVTHALELRKTRGRQLNFTIHTPRGNRPFVTPKLPAPEALKAVKGGGRARKETSSEETGPEAA